MSEDAKVATQTELGLQADPPTETTPPAKEPAPPEMKTRSIGAVFKGEDQESVPAADATTTDNGAAQGDTGTAADDFVPGKFYKDGVLLPDNYVPQSRVDEMQARLHEENRRLRAAFPEGSKPPEPGDAAPEANAGAEPWRKDLKEMPKSEDFDDTSKFLLKSAEVTAFNTVVESEGRRNAAQADRANTEKVTAEETASLQLTHEFQNVKIPAALESMGTDRAALDADLARFATVQMDGNAAAVMNEYILKESEASAELLISLAAAPVEYMQNLAMMSPVKMIAELGRADDRIKRGVAVDGSDGTAAGGDNLTNGGEGEQGTPKQVPGQAARVSAAPAPPKTLGGGVGTITKDLSQMTIQERMNHWKSEAKAGRQ